MDEHCSPVRVFGPPSSIRDSSSPSASAAITALRRHHRARLRISATDFARVRDSLACSAVPNERGSPVDVERTVQVIDLVLEDARRPSPHTPADGLCVLVEPGDLDLRAAL